MLPIICKGKGLIPRVGMIAPVFTPFKVDLQTLTIIMKTPGCILQPHFVDPDTSTQTLLTNNNWKSIYEEFNTRGTIPTVVADPTPKKDYVPPAASVIPGATTTPPPNENNSSVNPDKADETPSDIIPDGQKSEGDKDSENETLTPITKPNEEEVKPDTNVETGDNVETPNTNTNQNGFNNYRNNNNKRR